jgi:ferredoxin like protein
VKVAEKLAKNAIKNHPTTHIVLDAEACARCATLICVRACPAGLYQLEPSTAKVIVDHAGCLECGTCLIICPEQGVSWRYPEPGHGIRYRHG